jgi:uncharacterized protein
VGTSDDITRANLYGYALVMSSLVKESLRYVIGEFSRIPNLPSSKALSDEQVVKVLRKIIVAEESLGEARNNTFLGILEGYLPRMATTEEITTWIRANLDLSQFRNRMQAIKPVMAEFAGRAEGTQIKTILESL